VIPPPIRQRDLSPAEIAAPTSAARKIYPIVKYGDPILEKPGAPSKIRCGIGRACRGYVRFDVRAQGVGLGGAANWKRACGLPWWM